VIPSLSFFVISLVNVSQRCSYPLCVEQTVRNQEEKTVSKAKKEAKKVKSTEPKRKRGRPKGSKNKKEERSDPHPRITTDRSDSQSTP
jgi:hypothetical protein